MNDLIEYLLAQMIKLDAKKNEGAFELRAYNKKFVFRFQLEEVVEALKVKYPILKTRNIYLGIFFKIAN